MTDPRTTLQRAIDAARKDDAGGKVLLTLPEAVALLERLDRAGARAAQPVLSSDAAAELKGKDR